MNSQNILEKRGMVKIQKGESINGFDKTIIFELPEFIGLILQNKQELLTAPYFAIIKKGIISGDGSSVLRKNTEERIEYSLLGYDSEENNIFPIQRVTGERVGLIIGNMKAYITAQGELYTAKKYGYRH